jgi:uncharacterized protein YbjT (DUF2867 family)
MRELLVTGATGRIGGAVANRLAASGLRPRALVRDPAKGKSLLRPEVALCEGDLADEESLARAVEGVDAILLVSPVHPDQRRLQGNLVCAAAARGRPLIVKLSGLATRPDSFVDSGRWHAQTEADIRELGLPFVFLRPNFFMQNLAFSIPLARSQGVVRAAVGDARIAMVDLRDIADIAVELLTRSVDLTGEALVPTASEAYTYTDVAAMLSELLEREVSYERQSFEQARAALEKSGQPDWHVELLLQFNRAFMAGEGSGVSDAVERALGHPPRSLRDYLAAEIASSSPQGPNPFPS